MKPRDPASCSALRVAAMPASSRVGGSPVMRAQNRSMMSTETIGLAQSCAVMVLLVAAVADVHPAAAAAQMRNKMETRMVAGEKGV